VGREGGGGHAEVLGRMGTVEIAASPRRYVLSWRVSTHSAVTVGWPSPRSSPRWPTARAMAWIGKTTQTSRLFAVVRFKSVVEAARSRTASELAWERRIGNLGPHSTWRAGHDIRFAEL
jgi:hypothetical protein